MIDKKLNLNMDRVPTNLDEAVKFIKSEMTPDFIEFVKKSNSTDVHFSIGMQIRNDWSLWNLENHLVKWFEKEYGLTHADDISGIILNCVWMDIQGKPRGDNEYAKEIGLYWKTLKEAEESGCNISLEFDENNNVKITTKK
jgi:hypothetical protein